MIIPEEQIQDYIEDRLQDAEREAFEDRLRQEQELKSAYIQELARHTALIAHKRAEEKEALKKLFGQSDSTARIRSITPFYRITAVAAAVLLLLLAGYLLMPSKNAPEQLAMNYFEPYPMSNVRGETDEAQSLMDKALTPYQEGNFEEALPYLQQLQQAKPDNDQLKLNLASGLIAEKQFQEAIDLLQSISFQSADAAEWYLALAYLLNGQEDSAKSLLEEIAGKPHFRKQQAMELLEDL